MSEPTHGSAEGDARAQGDGAPEADGAVDRAHCVGPGRPRGRTQHRHPWVRRGLFVLAALVTVSLVLGIAAYVKLNGNIQRLDISDALGDRPEQQATTDKATNLAPVNILVMGSDSREGTNLGKGQTEYGMEGGALRHQPRRAPVGRPQVRHRRLDPA